MSSPLVTATVASATLFKMLARPARSVDHTLDEDGAELFAQALDEADWLRLEAAMVALPTSMPGYADRGWIAAKAVSRHRWSDWCGRRRSARARAHPVRAILFDKTAERNWALGWHQDRTIVAKERAYADGFGPRTVKSGLIQVEPAFDIWERIVIVHVHLDAVDRSNAPLRIVPGSHKLGSLPDTEIERAVATLGERLCLADRGDVGLYATPINHVSLAAER